MPPASAPVGWQHNVASGVTSFNRQWVLCKYFVWVFGLYRITWKFDLCSSSFMFDYFRQALYCYSYSPWNRGEFPMNVLKTICSWGIPQIWLPLKFNYFKWLCILEFSAAVEGNSWFSSIAVFHVCHAVKLELAYLVCLFMLQCWFMEVTPKLVFFFISVDLILAWDLIIGIFFSTLWLWMKYG